MKIVIFGLTVSSSWGNGHATLWRGLINALARRGHAVTFFERNTDFYAENRDLRTLNGAELTLYDSFADVLPVGRRELQAADVAITTSYCPDAIEAAQLMQECGRALAGAANSASSAPCRSAAQVPSHDRSALKRGFSATRECACGSAWP